jgi:hypothetical protein
LHAAAHPISGARSRFETCGPLCKGCAYVGLRSNDANTEHKTLGVSELYVLYTGTSFISVRRMSVQVATK